MGAYNGKTKNVERFDIDFDIPKNPYLILENTTKSSLKKFINLILRKTTNEAR
tara:strand:+ start:1259 stop:1417 length:159 start_codon:yes stop_codon:yes gene_type:complete